jgi:hypothetical protein
MKTSICLRAVVISAGFVVASARAASSGSTETTQRLKAPKIWDEKALATWALPVIGVNATPSFYSEAEYYAAPVHEYRTYPVYHPDREPPGYLEWLQQQEPKPLVDPAEIKTDADWVRLGRRVFEELDTEQFRTDDPAAIKPLRDREALKDSRITMTPDGQFPAFRWVVEARGRVRLSAVECAGCHMRVERDGTLLHGPPTNIRGISATFAIMFQGLLVKSDETGQPLPAGEQAYIAHAVPWLKDDIHARFRSMPDKEILPILRSGFPGTFNRFNGSPYSMTKIPDLIGVKDRRYLDATATHRNRGPEDIGRYGALVSVADDGAIGPHKFLTEKQRKLAFRHSDEAMYALGRYLYALEPPKNPNAFDERARHGKEIFQEQNCAKCHEAPLYTNNKLTPAMGFVAPADHPDRDHIMLTSVDTDPSLAVRTRKGTGVYKVPSLLGLWYRELLGHDGSVKTLEEWFDANRLEPDYVPSGWKGPGVTKRAVPGYDYGLDLSSAEKTDLIAFLKTL